MKAQKDVKTGKWLIQYRYTDWQGIRRKSTKRGFDTKREAEEWLRNFLQSQQADFNMKFEDFLRLYYEDMKPRIRENTMNTKKYIIDLKILPFFSKKSVNKITPADVRKWQNELISQGYSQTYLRTINNQLTAIFNFAVRYYDLKSNPCTKAGSMGKNSADEMKFWTKEEFSVFIDGVMDKQKSYVAFMTLFWTGMRVGELLALTPADINFDERTINISKSYQRLGGKDVVTPPKTPKSNRVITVPDFLLADIKDYMNRIYCLESTDRLFNMTKSFLEKEMQRGIKNSGVKRIRIHDIRHSHCALLFEMGITPLEVADRLGHERVETTLNTYAHLYPNKQRTLSDKLQKIYQEEF
ncbi:MAG: site-specific integrase [Clostridia bacterium]|nr:site-specific integrase [Clostridia bacterium]